MTPRLFLIGAGAISRHHASALEALPQGTPLFVADPNPEARASFLENVPNARMFPNSESMLASSSPQALDMVVVATPPRFHQQEAIKGLQSGRHVICEKPFAMDVPEAQQMVQEAQRLGLHISCCSNRFLKWELHQRVRQLIADGHIGRPYLVDFIHRDSCKRTGIEYQNGSWWFLDQTKNGGGSVMDWGPYDLSTLVDIFRPTRVEVSHAVLEQPTIPADLPEGTIYDIETAASASLQFGLRSNESVVVRYERTSATHGKTVAIEAVYGTEGYIEWDWLPYMPGTKKLRVYRTVGPDDVEQEEVIAGEPGPHENWVHAPVREFYNFLKGDADAAVLADQRLLEPFRVLRGIYDSGKSGQSISFEF